MVTLSLYQYPQHPCCWGNNFSSLTLILISGFKWHILTLWNWRECDTIFENFMTCLNLTGHHVVMYPAFFSHYQTVVSQIKAWQLCLLWTLCPPWASVLNVPNPSVLVQSKCQLASCRKWQRKPWQCWRENRRTSGCRQVSHRRPSSYYTHRQMSSQVLSFC